MSYKYTGARCFVIANNKTTGQRYRAYNSRQVRTTHSDTSHTDRLGLSVTGYEAIIDHINRGRPLDVVVAYTWPLLFTHLSNGTL